jgi:hypothetical protein
MKTIKQTTFTLFTLAIMLSSCNTNNQAEESSNTTDLTKEEKEITTRDKQDDFKFETYCNSRFGFCIDYPSNKLFPQGESANGDGQIFTSEDTETTLWVYRDFRDNAYVEDEFTIKSVFNSDIQTNNPNRSITYKQLGTDYYVVSGYNEDKIFYQKTMITDKGLATSLIEYPESEREYYDKVSETIFTSFE